MKFQVPSTVSLVFLSIVNMCMCVQQNLEKTINNLSGLDGVENHKQHNENSNYGNNKWGHENFLLTDYLADGEMERRISYKGITAKETSIGNSSKSLSLWQLSNGIAFIQMIYAQGNELIDCEYIRTKSFVSDFLQKFYNEIDQAKARNFTTSDVRVYHQKRPMVHVTDREFRQFDENGIMPDDYYEPAGDLDMDAFGMRNLTYVEIRNDNDLPSDILLLMDYKNLKAQCDKRHRQMQRIVHDMNDDNEDTREQASQHLERKKRALSDWLMIPNTKWCGRGQSAGKYTQLGGASKADKCCRRHDHCRFNIHAMTTKWHLFNYRPFTISHCSCDMRFRTCLKMADSSDAIMVGKLFFNIVQSKCFVLKPEKVCKKRSWWGKCEKKGIRKRAHLRDNRKF